MLQWNVNIHHFNEYLFCTSNWKTIPNFKSSQFFIVVEFKKKNLSKSVKITRFDRIYSICHYFIKYNSNVAVIMQIDFKRVQKMYLSNTSVLNSYKNLVYFQETCRCICCYYFLFLCKLYFNVWFTFYDENKYRDKLRGT